MHLIELIADNFKRLVAVRIRPEGALTPIVGKNGAGKTSVLDAIAAALGGAAETPEVPIRRGQGAAHVILDLGDITVSRRWTAKGSTLEVLSAEGAKYASPQAMLDKLVGSLSFDPLAFGRMKPADQVATLGQASGVDFAAFAIKRLAFFNDRTLANRQMRAAKAQLDGMAMPPADLPAKEVSVSEIAAEIEEAQRHNVARAERGRLARAADEIVASVRRRIGLAEIELSRLRQAMMEAEASAKEANDNLEAADEEIEVLPLHDKIKLAEQTNRLIRLVQERSAKAAEVVALNKKSQELTRQIEAIDAGHNAAIAAANLPIPGLSLQPGSDGGILLNDIPLAQCSGAEQLRTSVALGLALNPKLRLMLIRDGSLLDADGMKLLAELAEQADAQVLIERVATGNDVGVVIEDGEVANPAGPGG